MKANFKLPKQYLLEKYGYSSSRSVLNLGKDLNYQNATALIV